MATQKSQVNHTGYFYCAADVKVFANSLYDGDILAGQAEQPLQPRMPMAAQPPPMSPLSAGGSQKFQQQRVLAAQVC
jgi:hypothetical protein